MSVTTTDKCMILTVYNDSRISDSEIIDIDDPTTNFAYLPQFGPANLHSPSMLERLRTKDMLPAKTIDIDLGLSLPFNVFALIGCNASLTATRRFRSADDSGFTSGVIESGASETPVFDMSLQSATTPHYSARRRMLLHVLPVSASKRYFRWTQSDNSSTDPFMYWSICRIGLGLQFAYDYQSVEDGKLVGVPGAERYMRVKELHLHSLTREEVAMVQDIYATRLSTGRVVLIPEPLAPETWIRDAIWCTMPDPPRVTRIPYSRLTKGPAFETTLRFVEVYA